MEYGLSLVLCRFQDHSLAQFAGRLLRAAMRRVSASRYNPQHIDALDLQLVTAVRNAALSPSSKCPVFWDQKSEKYRTTICGALKQDAKFEELAAEKSGAWLSRKPRTAVHVL